MKSVVTGANPVCLTDSTDVISSINLSLIYEQMFTHCVEWKEHFLLPIRNCCQMKKKEIVNRNKLKTIF